MDLNTLRGLSNEVLYGIDRVPDLTDEAVVAACVDSLINRRHFLHPVEEYAESINLILREGRLSTQALEMSRRYSETELLEFLARLARQLDERRPWPLPAFVKLDVAQWSSFADAKPIARINRPMMKINDILNKSFDNVPIGAEKLPVMILELRSGDVVALMGSVNPRSTMFALMQRDPGDPAEVIARFCEFTDFSPEEVVPLAA
ncbi:MAG: hypothetical protein JWP76_2843 [Dactylosporangium sp.]|jgi:hypothetical protein|nr:hypothetical protein [Dactylosporangium sp.]